MFDRARKAAKIGDFRFHDLRHTAATERIHQCKELSKEVTILAITAHDTIGMKEAALEAGCDGYLTKPLDFDHLQEIIDRTLLSRK